MIYLQKVDNKCEALTIHARNELHPGISFPDASEATNEFLESVDLLLTFN